MTTCKACGVQFRKGRLALLLVPGGGLKGARVCLTCAGDGVLLVAPKLAPVLKEQVVRIDAVERTIRTLRMRADAARHSESLNFGKDNFTSASQGGQAEGLESAIKTLKRETGQ